MKPRPSPFQAGLKPALVFGLLVVLVNPFGRGQEALPISPALSLLIQHADQTYARVYNESAPNFFVNNPVNAAVVMGLAMHGQKLVADRDPQFLRHYEALRREAHDFLGELARVHGHRNPSDGQPMTRESLATVFDRNASGEYNQWAVQHRLSDPALVPPPMILDKVSMESLAKLHLKEPDSVVLLGQEASRVERDEGVDALRRFFEDRPGPPPPPVEISPVRENDIVGVWYRTINMYRLKFVGENTPGSILEFRSQGKPGHYIGQFRNLPSYPDLRYMINRIVPREQYPKNFNGFIYEAQVHGPKDYLRGADKAELRVYRSGNNPLILEIKLSGFGMGTATFCREVIRQ